MIRFITDSGADAPKELLNAYDFTVMPFGVLIGEDTFFDGESISPLELYAKMREGAAPKTFQVEVSRMVEVFTAHFKQGDPFIYLAFPANCPVLTKPRRCLQQNSLKPIPMSRMRSSTQKPLRPVKDCSS